jgi:hypothetical protein
MTFSRRSIFIPAFSLEAIVLALYLIRDAFGGMMRYYSSIYHVDALWYFPDAIAILCIGQFIWRCIIQNKSVLASLVLLQIFLSLALGYLMLGTFNALSSSFKMMLPVFVGFCFCDSNLGSYKKLLWVVAGTFYLSLVGVFLTKYFTMPWVGFKYESFGAVREAGRLWWAFSDQQRLMGFAADNTMAAFFILISFVMTSIRKSTFWCVLFGSIAIYAIRLTTSKTTMVVLGLYLVLLVIVRMLPEKMRFPAVRTIAVWSFAAILVPVVLILLFAGTTASSHSAMFSMLDRINNSWQLPFVYLSQLMPIGIFTGCGVGCFNYPQKLFSPLASYWVPVDNFYIGTYLMFGLPFAAFMLMVVRSTFASTDVYKLSLIFVVNLFTITVLNYGPATGLLIIALSFSEVFSRHQSRQTVRGDPGAIRRALLHVEASGNRLPEFGPELPRPAQ